MTEIIQFSNNVLYSREKNSWVWGVQHLTSSGSLPKEFGARVSLQIFRRGNLEIGPAWLGGLGVPYKAGRSYSLG